LNDEDLWQHFVFVGNVKSRISVMSEEIQANSSEKCEISYDKAKGYWENVEPTVCGMLGGIPEVGFIGKSLKFFDCLPISMAIFSFLDIQGSSSFLKLLFKYKPAPGKTRALDCGAGIGRVTKNLLMNEFKTVDLVEQDEKFCNKAKETLETSGHLGQIFNEGLQDFNGGDHKYDVIWSQWVLGHLTDDDLVHFFKRISAMLDKNGMIVVKENFTKDNEIIADDTDSSITRPISLFKKLAKQADLKIIKEARQTNFPKSLFPVYMIAMRPLLK
jgi:protein N-terminal methyltransferase